MQLHVSHTNTACVSFVSGMFIFWMGFVHQLCNQSAPVDQGEIWPARGGGSLEPPEGGAGGGSGNGAPVTKPLVKYQFFAILAIFSLNSGTNSRRSLRGIQGARAGPKGQFPSALNRDARVLMFQGVTPLWQIRRGGGKRKN